MKFKIISFKENLPELEVYKSFLKWQNCSYKLVIDMGFVLKTARGKPAILVYHGDELIATDFFDFIDYFNNKWGFKLI